MNVSYQRSACPSNQTLMYYEYSYMGGSSRRKVPTLVCSQLLRLKAKQATASNTRTTIRFAMIHESREVRGSGAIKNEKSRWWSLDR